MKKLSFTIHSRNFANYTYIYPVVSRRSQGISLGINLNINNACNWRCAYCQVDGLIRGKPIDIDLTKLEQELDSLLDAIINGDFITKFAPEGSQRFNDISLSGNGEPTLSKQFTDIVKIIARLRKKYNLDNQVKTILITNGSEIDNPHIIPGLKLLSTLNGKIWFKIDSVIPESIEKINQVHLSIDGIRKRLLIACGNCKTYIQTCWFKTNNQDPTPDEITSYIDFIASVKEHIAGVLMYSTARNPALPEGRNISSVSTEFLASIAMQLEEHMVLVKYYK
jgi:wyosine [tRNA(Phe)-imidazoG37] synthetase (radical SAM superfamily)